MGEATLLKILLVGALVAGGMAAVRDGRVLAKAGLVGSCHTVAVQGQAESSLQSCTKGRIDSYPDLTRKSCTFVYAKNAREYWTCPAQIVSSNAPRG